MLENDKDLILLYTTWPQSFNISSLAKKLIQNNECACVNVFSQVESYFKGMDEDVCNETIVIFKCAKNQEKKLIDNLVGIHPYETPCILSLTASDKTPNSDFLNWVLFGNSI